MKEENEMVREKKKHPARAAQGTARAEKTPL